MQPAVGWIAFGERAYGILFAGGGIAVGGISSGGFSVGIVSFGGFSIGLLALGGFAIGGLVMGGVAVGLIATGGFAIAWTAAMGGVAAAHALALGGVGLGQHVNDDVAREFYARYRWLDISKSGSRNMFWTLCFAPMVLQILGMTIWRRKWGQRMQQN